MGMRTVVMFNNDMAHDWSKDPELGQKILADMNRRNEFGELARYNSKVVEVTHADTVTLVKLGFYNEFTPLAYCNYQKRNDEGIIALLKQAADDLGYRLVKKSVK